MKFIFGWHIANSILIKSFEDKIYITPLKLNCLVYLVYSECLYLTGESLLSEKFIKTEEGPILSSNYYKFSSYGDNVIKTYVKDAKGKVAYVESKIFNVCLNYIWGIFKNTDEYDLLSYIEDGNKYSEKNNEEQIEDIDILSDIISIKEEELEEARGYIKRLTPSKNNSNR